MLKVFIDIIIYYLDEYYDITYFIRHYVANLHNFIV